MKSRRLREMRNAYRILFENPEWKRSLGKGRVGVGETII
jgi:hypothetical protein